MPKRRKRPRIKKPPRPEKKPRGAEKAEKANIEEVCWHLRIIDKDGPFGWDNVDHKDTIWEIIEKLSNFEKLKWPEILNRNNHSIQVAQLCSEAKRRLQEIEQDDIDELISFRLDGRKRLWGIRHLNVLKILWWDPNHLVCPSRQKRT
jgi:hypothetical protein